MRRMYGDRLPNPCARELIRWRGISHPEDPVLRGRPPVPGWPYVHLRAIPPARRPKITDRHAGLSGDVVCGHDLQRIGSVLR